MVADAPAAPTSLPRREGSTTPSSGTRTEPFAGGPGHSLVTLDGRYHVVERIATGGMGEVFRARDAVLDRDVALKVLHRSLAADPGFVEGFRREARAAAGLSHPNIVAVHDWGAVDGIYFMVMEYVRGLSLRELLRALVRLEPAQAADVLLQVLAALGHAHRMGIVHRDVKPENILVNREGLAKVADFGLARAYADARSTQVGTVTGTAQYLAPEQLRGEPADPRTDLYSLGIVGFELLTGHLPFSGETPLAVARRHLTDRVPRPSRLVPGLPPGLDGFILSATERDRELRPASAAEMRRDLERELPGLPPARPLGEVVADLMDREAPEAAHAPTVAIPRARHRTAPRRSLGRRAAGLVLAVLALAATAWGAWAYLLPRQTTVPRVSGRPLGEVQRELEEAGLVVRVAQGVYSLEVPEGAVIRAQPPPGTVLERGETVTLVPSLGPRPVEVPAVQGLTLAEARAALARVGLVGEVRRAFDDRVPAGLVVRQRPAAGARAHEGDAVALVVSRGPPPVPVPRVLARPAEEAARLLAEAGFDVVTVERFSEAVDRGYVISQDPAPRVEAPAGSTVTIVVSRGPRRFPLPSYLGMEREAAVAAIRADGLVPRVVQVPSGVSGKVVGQDPEPGTVVRSGATVTVYVA